MDFILDSARAKYNKSQVKIDDLLDLVNVDLVDQNLHQKLTPQKVVPTWVWAVGMFVAGFVIVRLFFKF